MLIVNCALLIRILPAGFSHAGDLAFVGEFPEADAADAVFAKVSVWPAADFTPVVRSGTKLGYSLLFGDH